MSAVIRKFSHCVVKPDGSMTIMTMPPRKCEKCGSVHSLLRFKNNVLTCAGCEAPDVVVLDNTEPKKA